MFEPLIHCRSNRFLLPPRPFYYQCLFLVISFIPFRLTSLKSAPSLCMTSTLMVLFLPSDFDVSHQAKSHRIWSMPLSARARPSRETHKEIDDTFVARKGIAWNRCTTAEYCTCLKTCFLIPMLNPKFGSFRPSHLSSLLVAFPIRCQLRRPSMGSRTLLDGRDEGIRT